MKKYLFYLTAITTISMATPACYAACDGFYVGIQGGRAKTHYDKLYQPKGIVEKIRITDSGPAGRIYWGYQWTQFAALELGYAKVKYNDNDNRTISSSSGILTPITKEKETIIDLVLKGRVPLGCRAGIFAKAGGAHVDIDLNHDHTKTRYCPTYGAGVSFDMCPKVPIEVTWQQVHLGGNFGNTNMVTLGVGYHFG